MDLPGYQKSTAGLKLPTPRLCGQLGAERRALHPGLIQGRLGKALMGLVTLVVVPRILLALLLGNGLVLLDLNLDNFLLEGNHLANMEFVSTSLAG